MGDPFSFEENQGPHKAFPARLPQPPEQVPQSPQAAEVAQIWQQNQEELKRRQAEAETRKQDLMLAERMATLMNPNVPKPARKFIYDELSKSSGVDPKGDTSKSVGTMLLALDPEALEGLNRNFAAKLKDAKPGEIKQLIQSVLTGKMSGMELLKVAGPPAATPATPAGGAGTLSSSAPPAPPAAPLAAPADTDVKRRRMPQVGETPAPYGIVEPGLVKALGIDYTKPLRVQDLVKEGYTIPFTNKEQQERAKEIGDVTAGMTDVMVNASKVHQLFAGKPETLGAVGAVARTVDQAMDQIKAVTQMAGIDISKTPGPGEKGLKSTANWAAANIAQLYKNSGIEQTAIDSARLEGAVLDMAYSMAVARGIPGNRLTNAIIAQHLNTLGRSQSVAQFEGALSDAVARATDRSAGRISEMVGGPANWTPNLASASNDALEVITASPKMLPEGLRKTVTDEIQKRLDVASGKASKDFGRPIQRSSPTMEEEQADVGKEEAARQRRLEFAEGREKDRLKMDKDRDERAARAETRAEKAAREKEEHTRFMENMALRREARLEAARKKDTIGAAFLKLGEMIGRSSSGQISAGSGGGGGGDQDASAFRIAQAQRRHAPQPVDASRYQRKAK